MKPVQLTNQVNVTQIAHTIPKDLSKRIKSIDINAISQSGERSPN